MSQFKLKRFYPTQLEIIVTAQQIVSLFPIEIQEHPFMGLINRVWRDNKKIYSVETLSGEFILDLSHNKKHLRIKDEKLYQILSELTQFEIILYYENKEDIYKVEKL
ncbi:MAG TPA: hypothetical protein ENK22_11340 [Persephonella sp.]|nr:hypothetical protein [Persephonella sp.]